MNNSRRVLAGCLAFLTLAFAPGLASYQAAAQVVNGAAAGRTGGIPVVPSYGANGAVLAPLSPAMAFAPGLTGFSAPALGAPAPVLSPVAAAALAPAASVAAAAAIPSLPASALAVPAQALAARALSAPALVPGASAPRDAAAAPAADAKAGLALAGEKLSAAADAGKAGILDAFFTGARTIYGRLTGDHSAAGSMVAQPAAAPVADAPAAKASASAAATAAQAPTPVALIGTGLQPGDKFLTAPAADSKPQVPSPAPSAPDAATGARALKWMYIQDAISMSVFIMTSIAYPMIVIPAVGAVTYGVLMALGPLAAIALGPLSGMIATRFAPREGLAILSGLRAVLTVALPILALTGMISFWPLLIASIANGWQFSLLMTSRTAYTRRFAITDPKQTRSWLHIGNLTTIGFSIYFVLQVLMGSIGQIGGVVDAMSPMMPFWISTAVNVGLVALNLWKIPKIANVVATVKTAAEPFAKKASAFVRKFWKEIALFAGTMAVYAWGLPVALPLIGTGLGSPLWMAGALLYWISRTDTFKTVMSTPKIRNALLFSALAAGLIYPFQNLAMPLIAASLGAKALIYGQLLGAFFFGQLLSNASMARLPEVRIPFLNKSVAAEKLLQAGVLALAAVWAGVRLFPGNILAVAGAVAVGAALIAVTSRLTNRGWIKFFGVGLLAAVGVALSWGFYPGIFASVMLLGLFVGPFVSAINAYISGNSDPKMVSQTFGVSSSLFNAMTSFGYGLLSATTKAYGDPAFPSALTPIIAVYLAAAVLFFFAPRWLPGLPEKSLRSPEPKKPAA